MTIKLSTAIRYQRALNDFTCGLSDAAKLAALPALQTARSILRAQGIQEDVELSDAVDQLVRVHIGSTAEAVRDANRALRDMEDFLS